MTQLFQRYRPNKNVWDSLEKKPKVNPLLRNMSELNAALHYLWTTYLQSAIKAHICSMPQVKLGLATGETEVINAIEEIY